MSKNILIITQNDYFYFYEAFQKLIDELPLGYNLKKVYILGSSPFGKSKGFAKTAIEIFNVFGFRFFIKYATRYVIRKFILRKTIEECLTKNNIDHEYYYASINDENFVEECRLNISPHVIISIGSNQIFKKAFLDIAKWGALNLHTGALPRYRGLMPTFWAMLNEETEVGVSVFRIDEGIDSGPLVEQVMFNINRKSQSEIIKETKLIGVGLIVRALENIAMNREVLKENAAEKATYFRAPSKSDVKKFYEKGLRF